MDCLCLDCGNSFIKCAVLTGSGEIISRESLGTDAVQSMPSLLYTVINRCTDKYRVNTVCYVSVVPSIKEIIQSYCNTNSIKCFCFTSAGQSTLIIDYDNPGDDRIAACVGAAYRFPGKNVIVIDAGTAITVDLITDEKRFTGGLIMPGLYTAAKSLSTAAVQLPKIEMIRDVPVIGTNTRGCIASGVSRLYEGGIRHAVDTVRSCVSNDPLCVITGGDSGLVSTILREYQPVTAPDLVIEGVFHCAGCGPVNVSPEK